MAFFRKKPQTEPEASKADLGFLVFQNTSEVLLERKALMKGASGS